jgi:hypothetical protein
MKADEIRKNLRKKIENLRTELRVKDEKISRLEAELAEVKLYIEKETSRRG